MTSWFLKERDLKKYPHFDSFISAKDALALAIDPVAVSKHQFYPFMRFTQGWNRFAKIGAHGKRKSRPIRYAARRDAYIFMYYRHQLSELYEAELGKLGLTESVIAYRRIKSEDGEGGKCNIHFARDAFAHIQKARHCVAIALDISSYFESLDHAVLKELWCRLLKCKRLPVDHFKVFERITRYSVVEKQDVYERLGLFGPKSKTKSGRPVKGYLVPYKNIPLKLCTTKQFREKIAGGAEPSIIKQNKETFGIPQGAPISDLLANIYLLDFDQIVKRWVEKKGGVYLRYSDDILIVLPGEKDVGIRFTQRISKLVRRFGTHLEIKAEKTSVFAFSPTGKDQTFELVAGDKGRNGIEYLGFRYDGKKAYIRDSTLSNLYRKVTRAARREAEIVARRYPDKSVVELKKIFNYERLIKKSSRVEDFADKQFEKRSWTFWTYATRASQLFGSLGLPIRRQLKKHPNHVRARADKAIALAVQRREKRKATPSHVFSSVSLGLPPTT